jgi:hypothetical protein
VADRLQILVYVKQDAHEILPPNLLHLSDHFNLLQHRILTRRWCWQTCDAKVGQVTMLMRKLIEAELGWRETKALLSWARSYEAPVLISDDHFVIGHKSKGYRLSYELESLPIRRIALTNHDLVSKIRQRIRRDYRSYTKAVRHLMKWYGRLECDSEVLEHVRTWAFVAARVDDDVVVPVAPDVASRPEDEGACRCTAEFT